jgi:peroxiredoxin Q/BCP
MAIQEGRKAPDFTLDDQDGNAVKLSGFAGKKNVLVYFYPRDPCAPASAACSSRCLPTW